jgi:hypothetical protein
MSRESGGKDKGEENSVKSGRGLDKEESNVAKPAESSSKPLKCGLVMPISALDGCSEGHWKEIQALIREALADTQFQVDLVSDSNEVGIIQKRIVQNLYDCDVVVCDVSGRNPNVMFELGMRLAFDKPAIIIKDDKTNYTFDAGQIEHIEYPRDLRYHSIVAFKEKIKIKVEATYEASKRHDYTTFLKHFGQFKVAKIDEKNATAEEVMLEMMGELRLEVRALARRVRDPVLRMHEYPGPSRRQAIDNAIEFASAHGMAFTASVAKELKDPESDLSKQFVRYLYDTKYQGIPADKGLAAAAAEARKSAEAF